MAISGSHQASTDPGDLHVDVVVVGSGAGGLTAALAAKSEGLDVLMIEKAEYVGGSSALSGGGLWIPGAPAQRRAGHREDPDETLLYLRTLTEGRVADARLQNYVASAPRMLDFLEQTSSHLEFVWKPGYPDYYPERPGGSASGSVINVPPLDLRILGDDADLLLPPHAMAPNGFWIRPNELKYFYQLRQSRQGKLVFARLLWRMVRARVTGERIVTVGQSLVARLMLAAREQGLEIWTDSPMVALLCREGHVVGARVTRDGREVHLLARRGVVLATGGFDHNAAMRIQHHQYGQADLSLGAKTDTGDGIRAGQEVGAAVDIMDGAWWYPAVAWPGGGVQFSLNERMMPAQLIVNGAGVRYINEATPYEEFGYAMIAGENSGVTHIPSWLITDHWSWKRYVIFGHLPVPWMPFAPVPTGRRVPERWLESGVVMRADTLSGLASQIGVPPDALQGTVDRYNQLAEQGVDSDFGRGNSVYDHYYGDPTLPNPNLAPLHGGPFYAFKLILSDLGTKGGLLTDEHARVLDLNHDPIPGLYATGNTSSSVMGYSYPGAGATLGPAMTFGYLAALHAAGRAPTSGVADPPGIAAQS